MILRPRRPATGPASRDINLVWDVFLLDRATGMTARVSADPETGWMESSGAPALDGTGGVLAFFVSSST
jgi:hypothetical protein